MPEHTTTTAGIVRFCAEMEAALTSLYDTFAELFPAHAAVFGALARDCEKTSALVARAYRETVTDALETGFAFNAIDLDRYFVNEPVKGEMAVSDARQLAVKAETTAIAFYEDMAAISLLATLPRVFKHAARAHTQHIASLNVCQPYTKSSSEGS